MSTWQGNVLRGTRAAQPAAAAVVVGAVYCITDEGNILERSTGAAWEAYSPDAGGGDVTAAATLTSGQLVIGGGGTAVNVSNLSGDVTTSGGVATTIANNAVTTAKILDANVTLAKIANAAANDKLLGSGNAGSGAPYAELSIGTGLTMTGTTLSASSVGGFGFTAPVTGDFSWINQGGAAVSSAAVWGTTADYLTIPASAGDNIRLRVKTAPAVPYTLTVAFIASFPVANFYMVGPAWRESGTGEIFVVGPNMDGSFAQARGYKAASATATPSVQAMTIPNFAVSTPWIYWMRLTDDNTDRKVWWSPDGTNWLEIFSELRTTFLTPDQLGWGGYISNATFGCQMTLLSWLEA